ncbi:MAG TPA: DUF2975 domain-containing protein [Chitinophagaceae bacterium]|jgi:hypothetical protein|nr:DUF2975 domain-containing protein [Chitinophagaceae bacterium]
MSKKIDYFRIILHVIAWIIFVGLSIEAAGFLVNTIATLTYTPEGAKRFWTQVDLSALYHHNLTYYITLTSLICIVTILKAIMFYVIVIVFYDKKVSMATPFNESVRKFILKIAYLSIGIGLFSLWGEGNVKTIISEGVAMPDLGKMKLDGGSIWLFMSVIFLVIAQVFKKGIEIQNENDLTV